MAAAAAGGQRECFDLRHLIERAERAAASSGGGGGERPTACGAPPRRPLGRSGGDDGAWAAHEVASRVAFATADIRRALAGLAELERRRRASCERVEGARAFKITRDGGGKDDLCPAAFCCLLRPPARAQAEARRRRRAARQSPLGGHHHQDDAALAAEAFAAPRVSAAAAAAQEEEDGETVAATAARRAGCQERRSGSISMNHLNEIRTSAAQAASAICCPSAARQGRRQRRRSGSYGVSNSLNSLATSAQQPTQTATTATREQSSSWLTSTIASFTSEPTSWLASFAPRLKQASAAPAQVRGDKFTQRRESIDFEEADFQPPPLGAAGALMASAGLEPATGAGQMAAARGRSHSSLALSEGASSNSSSGGGASGSGGAIGGQQGGRQLGKLVGKKAARLKELVLQNLGKADRTQDELFELYESNFYKQQQQAARLAKELKSYLAALKHFHEASRSLGKCVQQSTSDYQPARHDLVCESLAQLEALNEDLHEKLQERVLKQLVEQLSKFGEMRERISKRHRKLIDYDKSRRLYELMLAQMSKRRAKQSQAAAALGGGEHANSADNYHSILRGLKFLSQQQQQQQRATLDGQQEFIASQLVDEARLLKFREQFNYSKLMYESINGELHDELPSVYEKRMRSLLKALQGHFAIEAHYHANAAKLVASVSEVIDELPSCPGQQQQQSLEARKLSGGGGGARETLIGRSLGMHDEPHDDEHDEDDDDNEDDDDDDSYESSSSSASSRAGAGSGAQAGASDLSAVKGSSDKSRGQLAAAGGGGGGGGSSSGLGSSRGDSSCSVGSSSPECAAGGGEPVAVPTELICELGAPAGVEAEAEVGVAEEDDHSGELQGKAAGPAECSIGAAVAGCAPENSAGTGEAANPHQCHEPAAAAALYEEARRGEQQLLAAVAPLSAPGVLYKVRTNYKYLAEDVDELCFEPDEILDVVEFDESQEPEEGWLMGVRQINGQRGLFPANFTEPL